MKWKPAIGETFYYVFIDYMFFDVARIYWIGSLTDKLLWQRNNVFRTKKEARAKLKQIKKILKEQK